MQVPARSEGLDLLRGLAAFLVLAGHVRAFVFKSGAELEAAGSAFGLGLKAFYLATGLGHQAVVVFFALSGFLVGGKTLTNLLDRRFRWQPYLLRRLTRLWIVVIPVLVLTLILDSIGIQLLGAPGYDGRYYDLYASGPRAPVGSDLSLTTFLGNVAFLQTILVPIYGSNAPLWSLANEFWYYLIFPLAGWALLADASFFQRAAGCTLFLVLVALLPLELVVGGSIWVAGACAAYCHRMPRMSGLFASTVAQAAAVVLLALALVAAKLPGSRLGDIGLGILVASLLPFLANLKMPMRALAAVARASSDISYTLYLSHFPLLALLAFSLLTPARAVPGPSAFVAYLAFLAIALLWAVVLWWLCERHTDRLFAWLAGKIPRRSAG